MPIDPGVLSSIAALVERDASNVALRLHLAELLLEDGQATQALSHLSLVLASRPDDVKALDLGARAADAAGEIGKAESYRRMAVALGTASSEAAPSTVPEMPSADSPAHGGRKDRVGLRLVEGNRVDDSEPDVEIQQPAMTLKDVVISGSA